MARKSNEKKKFNLTKFLIQDKIMIIIFIIASFIVIINQDIIQYPEIQTTTDELGMPSIIEVERSEPYKPSEFHIFIFLESAYESISQPFYFIPYLNILLITGKLIFEGFIVKFPLYLIQTIIYPTLLQRVLGSLFGFCLPWFGIKYGVRGIKKIFSKSKNGSTKK